jgi:5-methyltetrahydrofolate--homocysteine methyltransferase
MDLGKLLAEKVLICDGAMGTELMRRGAPTDGPGDRLNLDMPELVEEIHREYIEAGSDLTITNTFGATAIKLAKFGLADRAREINLAGARLARSAAKQRALVAGDIGPCGEMLKPWGAGEPAAIRETFLTQAQSLAEGGVDCLMLETFFDLNEALLALDAARSTGLPVIASMTFEPKRGGVFTMMGNSAADCARALAAAGATVVGANCSVTISHMSAIAAALKSGADVPLILQPNAGRPDSADGLLLYHETPDHFAAFVPDLVAAGARIIGGCCGSSPEFVRAMRAALD